MGMRLHWPEFPTISWAPGDGECADVRALMGQVLQRADQACRRMGAAPGRCGKPNFPTVNRPPRIAVHIGDHADQRPRQVTGPDRRGTARTIFVWRAGTPAAGGVAALSVRSGGCGRRRRRRAGTPETAMRSSKSPGAASFSGLLLQRGEHSLQPLTKSPTSSTTPRRKRCFVDASMAEPGVRESLDANRRRRRPYLRRRQPAGLALVRRRAGPAAGETGAGRYPTVSEMLYSSGTTGRPKAVRRPASRGTARDHGRRKCWEYTLIQRYGMTESSVYLSPGAALPRGGGQLQRWRRRRVGARRESSCPDSTPRTPLRLIEKHRVNPMRNFVPTMFRCGC